MAASLGHFNPLLQTLGMIRHLRGSLGRLQIEYYYMNLSCN
jgi:hypothetical protein